jgi:FixJ family two-component response regulator
MLNGHDVTIEEIERAYEYMTEEERKVIDKLVQDLINAVKAKKREISLRSFGEYRRLSQFGPKQARELLARVGVWMVYHQPIGSRPALPPAPPQIEVHDLERGE